MGFISADMVVPVFIFSSFIISAVMVFLVVASASWHGRWTSDSAQGVQKIHLANVPRIGGLAIMIALCCCAFLLAMFPAIAPPTTGQALIIILICVLPAFLLGLAEDITNKIKPSLRLLACLVTGLLAWVSGVEIGLVEIDFIDLMLGYAPLSLLASMIVVAALSNAMNMLDGLNGLSSGYAMIAFSFFAYLALDNGVLDIGIICLVMIAVLAGFFVFNWPFGKLFLGDGGAYMIGGILAIIAIMLAQRTSAVTQALTLVILAYPAWEILSSMARRLIRSSPLTQPDNDHLHTRLYHCLKQSYMPAFCTNLANPLAAVILVVDAFVIIAVMIGITQHFDLPSGSKLVIVICEFILYTANFIILGRLTRTD